MDGKNTKNADYVYGVLQKIKKDPKFETAMCESVLENIISEHGITLTTRMRTLLLEMIRI